MLGIQTYTCKEFDPLHPKLESICIDDIAHSLSLLCRYLGHCKWLYTVGQHSILGARWIREQGYPYAVQLQFLLHDGSEAYLNDIPRPLKISQLFNNYRAVETTIQRLIEERFGITNNISSYNQVVTWVDRQICISEARQILHKVHPESSLYGKPELVKVKIDRWTPEQTENTFLDMFFDLQTPRRTFCTI